MTTMNHNYAMQARCSPQMRRVKQALWLQWAVIAVTAIFLSVSATATFAQGPGPSPSYFPARADGQD